METFFFYTLLIVIVIVAVVAVAAEAFWNSCKQTKASDYKISAALQRGKALVKMFGLFNNVAN